MKRHFRFYFFSIFIILYGCAQKDLPPPLYSGIDLTLNDVISISGKGIDSVKAVLDIYVEKENSTIYHTTASVLIKRPGMVHIRTYNLGILTSDIIIREDDIHVLHGRINKGLEPFIKRLYDTVFWWDSVKSGYMHREGSLYIIRKDGMRLSLDSATLMPLKQETTVEGRIFHITYDRPLREGDLWYPSSIEITTYGYRFLVTIERLFINPVLSENDFLPSETLDQGRPRLTQ